MKEYFIKGTIYALFQNLLFYYDSEACNRPSGVVLLEGCYCERLITPTTSLKNKDLSDKQVKTHSNCSPLPLT
jgi:hypothetical protein